MSTASFKLVDLFNATIELVDACTHMPGGAPYGTMECRICGSRWDRRQEQKHTDMCELGKLQKVLTS